MKDRRVATLMKALRRRFPETTLITGTMADAPGSGETLITVLNAPDDPPRVVKDYAWSVIWDLWGDEPWPALVRAVNREQTAKYYAKHLPKTRPSRRKPRRRVTSSAKK